MFPYTLSSPGPIWVFLKIGEPQHGWFIMEIPIKMGWCGGKTHYFRKHPYIFQCLFSLQNSRKVVLNLWGFGDLGLGLDLGVTWGLDLGVTWVGNSPLFFQVTAGVAQSTGAVRRQQWRMARWGKVNWSFMELLNRCRCFLVSRIFFENIQYTYLFRFWLLVVYPILVFLCIVKHFTMMIYKCVQVYVYIHIYIMYDTYLCEQCPRY